MVRLAAAKKNSWIPTLKSSIVSRFYLGCYTLWFGLTNEFFLIAFRDGIVRENALNQHTRRTCFEVCST